MISFSSLGLRSVLTGRDSCLASPIATILTAAAYILSSILKTGKEGPKCYGAKVTLSRGAINARNAILLTP